MSVAERLALLEEAIARACAEAGRPRAEVCLVAVSKTHPAEAVREAHALGLRDFGESYAQELTEKRGLLDGSYPDIRWHFIGRVQRNKAKLLAGIALIHGCGSLGHVEAVQRRAPGVAFLTQVNVSGEEQKNGFDFEELRRDSQALLQAGGGMWRGLMAMLEQGESGDEARRCFARVRELRDELQARLGVTLPVLSMGMTGDFREAILEGATHVRIGTALFGARGT